MSCALKNDENHGSATEGEGVVCPALVLANKVTCDARGQVFYPGSRQVREYCVGTFYTQCPLFTGQALSA